MTFDHGGFELDDSPPAALLLFLLGLGRSLDQALDQKRMGDEKTQQQGESGKLHLSPTLPVGFGAGALTSAGGAAGGALSPGGLSPGLSLGLSLGFSGGFSALAFSAFSRFLRSRS